MFVSRLICHVFHCVYCTRAREWHGQRFQKCIKNRTRTVNPLGTNMSILWCCFVGLLGESQPKWALPQPLPPLPPLPLPLLFDLPPLPGSKSQIFSFNVGQGNAGTRKPCIPCGWRAANVYQHSLEKPWSFPEVLTWQHLAGLTPRGVYHGSRPLLAFPWQVWPKPFLFCLKRGLSGLQFHLHTLLTLEKHKGLINLQHKVGSWLERLLNISYLACSLFEVYGHVIA